MQVGIVGMRVTRAPSRPTSCTSSSTPGPAGAGLPAPHAELHPPRRARPDAVRRGARPRRARPGAVGGHLSLAGHLNARGSRPCYSRRHENLPEPLRTARAGRPGSRRQRLDHHHAGAGQPVRRRPPATTSGSTWTWKRPRPGRSARRSRTASSRCRCCRSSSRSSIEIAQLAHGRQLRPEQGALHRARCRWAAGCARA